MSNSQNQQHWSSRSGTLRLTTILLVLGIFLAAPSTLAAESVSTDETAISEDLMSAEQKSVTTTSPNKADNRDDLEPSTLALLALGLIALGLVRRKVRE